MPTTSVRGVRLRGVAGAVPRAVSGQHDVAAAFGQEEASKLAKSHQANEFMIRHLARKSAAPFDRPVLVSCE